MTSQALSTREELESLLLNLTDKEAELKSMMEEVGELRKEVKNMNTTAGQLMADMQLEDVNVGGIVYVRREGVTKVTKKKSK